MSRIKQVVSQRLGQGGKLLIPYLVAGDPNLQVSLRLMHALVAAGADIIELGMPFSDPSSDGAVIQQGSERALAAGTTLADVLALVKSFRTSNQHTAIVLMGYLNPLEVMGYGAFASACADAGVDGVLIVDMPPGESRQLGALLEAQKIDLVFLVAPTTSTKRAESIVQNCSGYLYYVSLKGVTGAAITDTQSIEEAIARLRTMTKLPIVIGFGIKSADNAVAMARLADGVVIGSALVAKIAQLGDSKAPSEQAISATVALIADSREALAGLK